MMKLTISDWVVALGQVVLVTLLVLFFMLAGCSTLPEVRPAELPAFVQTGPTVVMFTKPVCPPCDVQEAILAGLAVGFPEINFGKVYAYNFLIQPTDPWMVNVYNLQWTPTTVFQVDGVEVCRWVTLAGEDQIQPVLRGFIDDHFEFAPGWRVKR